MFIGASRDELCNAVTAAVVSPLCARAAGPSPPAPRPFPDSQRSDASRSSARSLAMRVYLALVALSAGASATPSAVEASTPAGVAETHVERELLTRSEAKTRQLERKLAKVKAKREKADAKVKKVEDALGLPHSVTEAVAAECAAELEEEAAAATADMFSYYGSLFG